MVAGFGSAVLDVLMRTEKITLYGKNPVSHQIIQMGGVIPTALIVLSRLGVRTELYTIIGDDMLGTKLCSILSQENVDSTHVVKSPTMTTPLATVILEKETRTIFYTTADFSKQFDQLLADSLSLNSDYLLIDGHNAPMSHAFIKKARLGNTKIIMDLGTPKDGLEGLIKEVDTIIVPGAYWKTLPQRDPKLVAKELLGNGPTTVIVTMEDKGIFVATKDDIFYQPSYHVTAQDTNGAGDVFFGTLIYGLLKNWTLPDTVKFAAAAAALSCTKIGKDAKISRSESAIRDFMVSQPK
jgi:sulfofructose kinase